MARLLSARGSALSAAVMFLVVSATSADDKRSAWVILQDVAGRHPADVTPAEFAPDGNSVAIALPAKREIGLWQTSTGKRARALATQGVLAVNTGQPSPTQLVFSPDSRLLAATLGTLYHGHLVVWDLQTGKPAWGKAEVAGIHSFPVTFDPHGEALVTTGRADKRSTADVTFWGTSDGRVMRGVKVRAAGELGVQALAFSGDGKRWASTQFVENASAKRAGWSSTVSVWDRLADRPERKWSAASGQVHSLWFTPHGDLLIGRCGSPHHIEVWDSHSGALRQSIALGNAESWATAVSSDGKTLTAAAGKGLRQWDLATGRLRGNSPDDAGRVLALSPDAKRVLMFASDGSLRVREVASLMRE